MSSSQVILPFPKTPITRLFKNPNLELKDVTELREFEESLRQHSDNYELYAIRNTRHSVAQIRQRIISKKHAMEQLNQSIQDIDEYLKLHNELEDLIAHKFVTEMSACMSVSTNERANTLHKNAAFSSKYMLKASNYFQVSNDGKIQRTRKVSSIAKWDPIPEDFIVSEESDDSDDDSVYSVASKESDDSDDDSDDDSFFSMDSVDSIDSDKE